MEKKCQTWFFGILGYILSDKNKKSYLSKIFTNLHKDLHYHKGAKNTREALLGRQKLVQP